MTDDHDPKQRLLARTVEHLAERGAADLSLRGLAAAIGTSHRMLIYHFGSKEGLLVEVVRLMEQRQREVFADLAEPASRSPFDAARQFWDRLADPAMWPYERLFFAMCGRALQGDAATAPVLDGIVTGWLETLTAWNREHGLPDAQARAHARLGIAVTRGLLLDLLCTGDRAGVDEAMEHFVALAASLRRAPDRARVSATTPHRPPPAP